MPLIVGATILENYEDVKRLLEVGYDPNESGPVGIHPTAQSTIFTTSILSRIETPQLSKQPVIAASIS